jgi:hypothetical protein
MFESPVERWKTHLTGNFQDRLHWFMTTDLKDAQCRKPARAVLEQLSDCTTHRLRQKHFSMLYDQSIALVASCPRTPNFGMSG